MKNTEVTITIDSIQHDTDGERTQNVYKGHYKKLSDKHVISYEESFAENGEESLISKNLIKFTKDTVHITKRGAVNSQMHFEAGKTHADKYHTPFGLFDMVIDTKKVSIEPMANGFFITLCYTMRMNQAVVSDTTLTIHIQDI